MRSKFEAVDSSSVFISIVTELTDIFVEGLLNALPSQRDPDFEIKLKSNKPPPMRLVVLLSAEELQKHKR